MFRFWALGKNPPGLYWDEVAMMADVRSVLSTGKDIHGLPWQQLIYPSYGDYKLAPYIWLATASSKIFGLSEWSLRFPSFLAGVTSLILIWYVATLLRPQTAEDHDKNVMGPFTTWPVWSVWIWAISPWGVVFSRTGFEGHVAQSIVLLAILFVLKGLQSATWGRQLCWAMLATVTGMVATLTYFSVRFVLPEIWLFLLLYVAWQKRRAGFSWLPIVSSVVGLLLFVILQVWWLPSIPLYQETNRFRLSTASVLQPLPQPEVQSLRANLPPVVGKALFNRFTLVGYGLAQNYADHLTISFLFLQGDPNLRHGTGQTGLFLWPLAVVFVIGLYAITTFSPSLTLLLIFWWLSALLPAAVPESTPHALRSLQALAPLSLILGFGMAYCGYLVQKSSKLILLGLFVLFLVFTTGLFIVFGYDYFNIYPSRAARAWQYGFSDVAKQVSELSREYPAYIWLSDDKFFLWLLAYGRWTPTEIQNMPQVSFQFPKLETVYFSGPLPLVSPFQGNHKIVVTAEKDWWETVKPEALYDVTIVQKVQVPGTSQEYRTGIIKKIE